MQKILTPDQMRAAEKKAMDSGLPGILLMENAAACIAKRAEQMARGGEVLFLCGSGNNGGDGFAAARILRAIGGNVRVVFVGDAERLSADARANYERLAENNISIEREYRDCRPALVVDALFGTGLARAPQGEVKAAIEWMNSQAAPVLAVDLPSGVDARDGSTPGSAARADITLTFHARKTGNVLFPGRALCGTIEVCDIGIEEDHDPSLVECVEPSDINRFLPKRAMDAHKGTFGRVLIVAGSLGMAGAAALCARATLHAGAGLTKIATTKDVLPVAQILAPEATAALLPENDGAVSPACFAALGEMLRAVDVAAVGPGMTPGPGTLAAVRACLRSGKPCVIDADGLNALAAEPAVLKDCASAPILTPHPGEMARLLGRPVCNPLDDARIFAAENNAVLLLKGATTVISAPDGRATVNLTGTPAMARGGSGDVLTGIIAALLAQGLSPYDAARVGAYLHGKAGEAAERRHGIAMTAMDLPKYLFSE